MFLLPKGKYAIICTCTRSRQDLNVRWAGLIGCGLSEVAIIISMTAIYRKASELAFTSMLLSTRVRELLPELQWMNFSQPTNEMSSRSRAHIFYLDGICIKYIICTGHTFQPSNCSVLVYINPNKTLMPFKKWDLPKYIE